MADVASSVDFEACRETVRAGDKDFYLAALFVPEALQRHIFSLLAFAVELARIPALVSEPQIGEIRLQWWADTLETLPEAAGSHPVARALADTVRSHELPLAPFARMVEARRSDLYAEPFEDEASVETYFGETVSALIQMQALVIDKGSAAIAAEASGLAGVAFGLARELARTGQYTGGPKSNLQEQNRAGLLNLAVRRYAEAREAIAGLPRGLLPAFLPVATVELYLKVARKGGGSVPQWRRQWRIWRAAASEKI